MFILIVGLLGYWMGPDSFGGSLINAVESVEILMWIIAFLAGILMISITGVLTFGGISISNSRITKILGGIAGTGAGLLISVFAFLKLGIVIYLCQWLAGSIDPSITSFDNLSTTQIVVLVLIIILPFLNNSNNSNSSK